MWRASVGLVSAFSLSFLACTPFAADSGPADAGTTSTDTASDDRDDSLVVHVPFDEVTGTTAADVTKNGHDITINGGAIWGGGRSGGAYVGNGSTSYGTGASSPRLDRLQTFTVAVWVKAEKQSSPTPRVVSKRGSWDIKLNAGHPQLTVIDDKDRVWYLTLAFDVIAAWHRIAFTFDAGAIRGFIDGFERSTLETNLDGRIFSAKQSADDLYIGQGDPTETTSLLGRIDELRIYDRALDDAEIKAVSK